MKKLVFILAVLTFFSCKQSEYITIVDRNGNELAKVNVEIANTNQLRQTGLMYREKLDKNSGMLFVFEQEQILSFWMKNTYIALDIAYISKDFQIIDIFPLTPLSQKSVISSDLAKYALEVNAGFYRNNNINIGAYIKIPEHILW